MFGVIFEEKQAQIANTMHEVERLAFHDALTDLPNRLLFMDRAGIEFAHAKRAGTQVAIAFIDLDRFKLVNDTFGHDAGDDVLRAIAGRLREALREVDTIARLGGDEFTLLLPGIRRMEDVTRIADKLLDVFRIPLHVGDRELLVTASIGISLFPSDGVDAEALVRNADAAMYRAKERGGANFQMYTQSLTADAHKELEIEARLRLAVAREEFVLHYQPRVDASMERVVAFESLVRWNDPERGLVMPGEFIHIAESSGLIIGVGQWVIRTACRQVREWQRKGHDVYVSVNLSPRQFHHHDLNNTITDALARASLPSKYLELEVDESCVMNNAEASMRILNELKAIGVRVLISHFGTGYSSLRNLRRFPIDGLKLDRSFASGDDRSLATAALGMAKALQLKVIGEGVETHEDAEFLRANACDDIQGFLFSAAVPADECSRFFTEPMVSVARPSRIGR
jgi:diguanylate cyclase (GGDEF)-like protein